MSRWFPRSKVSNWEHHHWQNLGFCRKHKALREYKEPSLPGPASLPGDKEELSTVSWSLKTSQYYHSLHNFRGVFFGAVNKVMCLPITLVSWSFTNCRKRPEKGLENPLCCQKIYCEKAAVFLRVLHNAHFSVHCPEKAWMPSAGASSMWTVKECDKGMDGQLPAP